MSGSTAPKLWSDEAPFQVNRHPPIAELEAALGADAANYSMPDPPDDEAIFRYVMHTLPAEVGDRIGTSMLFAAWSAAIYVNQIEDERLGEIVPSGATSKRRNACFDGMRACGSTTRRSS